ncbi:secreted RxLR effector protein 161-like [Silene latifolia]|uniref:secreted RxLR effector protein 161-like n=1 Tax=Silene latifolia TaxID=37657 RepID=UPI003D7747BA
MGAEKADPTTYTSIVGCLLYLTASRPDLMFTASLLSRFMQNPSQHHYTAAKRVLRYIRGSTHLGLWYKPTQNSELVGYTNSNWGGSVDDMKSTSRYAYTLGSGILSWQSQKQDNVAQSTAEAE